MFKIIQKLQNKPEGTRRRIALVITVSVTGFVFLVWILTVSSLQGDVNNEKSVVREITPISSLTGIFRSSFKDLYEGLVETVSNVSSPLNEATSVVE